MKTGPLPFILRARVTAKTRRHYRNQLPSCADESVGSKLSRNLKDKFQGELNLSRIAVSAEYPAGCIDARESAGSAEGKKLLAIIRVGRQIKVRPVEEVEDFGAEL